jgi:hypothetical protein
METINKAKSMACRRPEGMEGMEGIIATYT